MLGRFWLGAMLPMLFVRSLSHPYGLVTETFCCCWAMDTPLRVSGFRGGWPTTVLTLHLNEVCTPTCTFLRKPLKGTSTRTELIWPAEIPPTLTRRIRRCPKTFYITPPRHHRRSSNDHIDKTRFPRLPPGTTYLLPFGKPLRHPAILQYYRPESNIRKHP